MLKKMVEETVNNPLLQYAEMIGDFPVRIGAPSYVWPGGYSYNTGMLSPVFREIQLLVFEDFDTSPLDIGEIDSLRRYSDEGVNFSVHLPVPNGLSAASGDTTPNPVESLVKIIKSLKPLNVTNYILHIDFNDSTDAELLNKRLLSIADEGDIAIEVLSVENIDDTFDNMWESVGATGLSICCDVGHLLHAGKDPFKFIDKYEDKIRMVHIHGAGKKDHIPLTAIDKKVLVKVIDKFAEMKIAGPVIIENYSVDDMQSSLNYLNGIAREGLLQQCPA